MISYNKHEILYSLHIPKCGGTSLLFVLKMWFKTGLHHHFIDEKNNKNPEKISFKRYLKCFMPICIHGHFNRKLNCDIHTYYPSAKQFITFIRDPIKLHISDYFYIKNAISKGKFYNQGKKILENRPQSINDYLENYPMSKYIDNIPNIFLEGDFVSHFEKNFIHIGIIENYQKSLDILAQKLNMPSVKIPVQNSSFKDEEINPNSVKKFIDKHKFEYSIYEFALKLNN